MSARPQTHSIGAISQEIDHGFRASARRGRVDGPKWILFCGGWCPPMAVRRVSQWAPWEPAWHMDAPWLTICRGCLVVVARSTDHEYAISAADRHWYEKHETKETT